MGGGVKGLSALPFLTLKNFKIPKNFKTQKTQIRKFKISKFVTWKNSACYILPQGALMGGHIFRLSSWVVLDKSIILKTDELGTNFKAMDELEILRMLCKVAVEQDKQITEQEKAIRELSDEVNEILEVMMDGQPEPGD